MRSVTSAPVVKKIITGVTLVIIAIVIFLNVGGKENVDVSEQGVYQNTINISRDYVSLRLKTNKILEDASSYPDYDTWDKGMNKLIDDWKSLETKADLLEDQAEDLEKGKLSFGLIKEAKAYTKDEISNVFDKAPAGRKIRTLAKFLGVDAKRAFKILKNDQEFVKADAWNEAGDTFKKLEVSAILIKDGCKVAGFIGAAAMTGGATAGASLGSAGVGSALLGGTATLAEGTVMIVTGTDLILEVGEDAATIGLGDGHKVTKMISGVRTYTEPAASILSLTDIPKNIAKGAKLLDKVGVILIQVDQIRSMTQDGKLLGINITPDSKIEIAAIKEGEVEKWIDENKREGDSSRDWMDGFGNEIQAEESIEVGEGSKSEEAKAESQKEKDEKEVVVDEKKQGIKKVYTKDGKVSVWIDRPHGALSSGGTQLWEVKVDGYEYYGTDNTYVGENRGYKCYWDYYTEYDEGAEPWINTGGCKSTHGVPGRDIFVGEPSGALKAVVRVEFLEQDYDINEWGNRMQKGKKVVETVTLEENYEITPYFYH